MEERKGLWEGGWESRRKVDSQDPAWTRGYEDEEVGEDGEVEGGQEG